MKNMKYIELSTHSINQSHVKHILNILWLVLSRGGNFFLLVAIISAATFFSLPSDSS